MAEEKRFERLRRVKILQPVNSEFLGGTKHEALQLIREHEKRVGSEPVERPVRFLELKTRENWVDFNALPHDYSYYDTYGNEWMRVVGKMRLNALMMANRRKVEQILHGYVGNMRMLWLEMRIGKKNGERASQTISQLFTIFLLTDMIPVGGEDAFDPLVQVVERGFVPRSVKDEWIVGYRLSETQ